MSAYPYFRGGFGAPSVRFKKRKSRFSFAEVQLLLTEVRKNRHILVGKFNRGISSDVKKRKWAALTARINEISECPREVLEIIKKWSDLKCDTKRKVAAMRASGASPSRISRDLSTIEGMVHQILQMPMPDHAGRHLSNADCEDDDDDADGDGVGALTMPQPPSGIPNGYPLGTPSMPPPSYVGMASKGDVGLSLAEDPSLARKDLHFETVGVQAGHAFNEVMQERNGRPALLDQSLGGVPGGSRGDAPRRVPNHQAPSSSVPPAPPPRGPSSAERTRLQEEMARSAFLSLQEQQVATTLMGALSRSLESLADSVQRLADTQREFARDALSMQRDTLHVLRDFSASTLTLLHDKLNGHP